MKRDIITYSINIERSEALKRVIVIWEIPSIRWKGEMDMTELVLMANEALTL